MKERVRSSVVMLRSSEYAFSVKKGLMRVCLEVRAINYCVFCAFVSRWFFSFVVLSRDEVFLSISTFL